MPYSPVTIAVLALLLIAGVVWAVRAQQVPSADMNLSPYLTAIPGAEYDRNILYYAGQAYHATTLDGTLEATSRAMESFLATVPPDSLDYAYGRGKWTVGQVLQHIISYEYIMAESALVIAGRAPDPLQHQRYTQSSTAAGAEHKSIAGFIEDFRAARTYSQAAFASLTEAELRRVGQHEGFRVSPRVLAACISGHQAHHFAVLRERYL